MVSKGKFGLINENGREIIPAKYEDVGNFPVLRDKKTGALLDEAAFYTKADQSAFPATKQEIQSLLLPKPHAAESQLPSSRSIIFISLIRNPKVGRYPWKYYYSFNCQSGYSSSFRQYA